MYQHEIKIRVRYPETDRMGYLYHGVYCQYYEAGRTEALRSLGITYRDLEEQHGIMMPVVSLQVRYLRPATYDEELRLVTTVTNLDERYIRFLTEIYNKAGKLINQGKVKLCFLDARNMTPIKTPAVLTKLLV